MITEEYFSAKLLEHTNIDILLREHKSLNEKFGIFPDADNILKGLQKFVKWITKEANTNPFKFYMNSGSIVSYMFMDCLKNTGIFFKDVKISITVWFQSTFEDEACNGMFMIDDTKYNLKNDPINKNKYIVTDFIPYFNFVFNCSEEYFLKEGVNTFVHEIMHAYEFYKRLSNGKIDDFSHRPVNIDGIAASQYVLDTSDDDYKIIYNLFYIINNAEINAFAAEVKATVASIQKYNLISPERALLEFKKSAVYRRTVKDPENKITELNNISDTNKQKKILNFANYFVDRQFNSYEQLIKYFSDSLDRIKIRIMTIFGKWLGWGNVNWSQKNKGNIS